MKDVKQILLDRLILKEKKSTYFEEKFQISKEYFNQNLKSIERIKVVFSKELVVIAYKLFESKINADIEIYKWNKKNPHKYAKKYNFRSYSELDNNGKSIKSKENFNDFFNDIEKQYAAQSKSLLQNELTWIKDNSIIKANDCVCFYCGINEQILSELYNDKSYTCKTKRNRGSWFELDRRDARSEKNIYSKDNMVLCCYFCNNHKSDVISSNDMRHYFGESMFQFLTEKYNLITKK